MPLAFDDGMASVTLSPHPARVTTLDRHLPDPHIFSEGPEEAGIDTDRSGIVVIVLLVCYASVEGAPMF